MPASDILDNNLAGIRLLYFYCMFHFCKAGILLFGYFAILLFQVEDSIPLVKRRQPDLSDHLI